MIKLHNQRQELIQYCALNTVNKAKARALFSVIVKVECEISKQFGNDIREVSRLIKTELIKHD